MKKFEMTIAGELLKWEEKSYAANFRNFWNHFIDKDIEKTKQVVELTGIRTSDNEFFVAQNGSKKKNIPVEQGLWIYTHLTPQAMDKCYEKFAAGWEGRYVKPTKETKAETPAEAPVQGPMTEEEWLTSPEAEAQVEAEHKDAEQKLKKMSKREEQKAKAAEIAERQRLAKETKAQKAAERKAKKEAEKQQQQLTTEDIENVQL